MKESVAVEFLAAARLGEKGQVTVPKEFREALALGTGSVLAVLRMGNALLLIPEEPRFRKLCDRISSAFVRHGKTAEDLLATLPEMRRKVYERRYPDLAKMPKHRSRKLPARD
jgi:AbrB family looped-hinge helix DNA binding protein